MNVMEEKLIIDFVKANFEGNTVEDLVCSMNCCIADCFVLEDLEDEFENVRHFINERNGNA